jgi:hypothetical protein
MFSVIAVIKIMTDEFSLLMKHQINLFYIELLKRAGEISGYGPRIFRIGNSNTLLSKESFEATVFVCSGIRRPCKRQNGRATQGEYFQGRSFGIPIMENSNSETFGRKWPTLMHHVIPERTGRGKC